MSARICITGVGGYVGLATADAFAKAGHYVVGIGSRPERPATLPAAVHYLSCDVTDTAALIALFQAESIDTVYHFAANKFVGVCETNPAECERLNVGGTKSVLDAMVATGVKKIVYASTYAVYDWSGEEVHLTESSPTLPATVYGRTKLESEKLIQAYAEQGLIKEFYIFRYGNIVGMIEGLHTAAPQSFLDKIVMASITGDTITLNGGSYPTADGTVARDFVDIRDVATLHVQAVMTPGNGVYNVSSHTATTLRALVTAVESISGKTIPLTINPATKPEPAVIVIDNADVQTAFSWSPHYSIGDTIGSILTVLRT